MPDGRACAGLLVVTVRRTRPLERAILLHKRIKATSLCANDETSHISACGYAIMIMSMAQAAKEAPEANRRTRGKVTSALEII